jgi:hypothetical protein
LVFFTCKKDPSIPNKNASQECNNSTYYPVGDTLYNLPRFNPNNANEIIYLQGIQSTHITNLVKRNLITGKETFIVNNVWQMSDWNVKDWIVFNHADNQVWKIKSNGDSLTLITTNMQGGFYAIWSPDGNKIAYNTGVHPYTLICDANGNYLDSLPYQISYLTQWSKDGSNICGLAKDYINIVYQNVYTHQGYQPTNNIPIAHSINTISAFSIGWLPNSQDIIWASWQGLYKTNIITKQTTLLKPTCTNRYYTAFSISPDGQKIIAQRIDVASGLCLMDIDGKNEVIIK